MQMNTSSNPLNPDQFDGGRMNQSGWTSRPRVALTGEVFSPVVQVGCRGETHRHVLPVGPQDAEVGGVQVQVVVGVVPLPYTPALPLAQDLAAEHGGRSHVGDVGVEGGRQVLGQRLTGSLQGAGLQVRLRCIRAKRKGHLGSA